MSVQLGLFGGTFDPPHVGHYLAASDAFEALKLDELIFIPAGVQPFKQGSVQASPADRLEMLRRMTAGDPRFSVDAIEVERPGLSYTVETLGDVASRHAGATLFLLIGEDLAGQIESWRAPEEIARRASIVVLSRSGGEQLPGKLPMRRLYSRRVDVSSTEIRERCAAGRSIRGFVMDGVADYIDAAGLYR